MKTINTKTMKSMATGLLVVTFALFCANVQAASDTWTGANSANWSGSNWTGGNNPPSSGDSLVFTSATGAGGTALNDDLTSSSFNLAEITYNSGAAAFTLGGNAFNLTGGVLNSSTSLETINDPFSMTATQSFTNSNGGSLTLGGSISGAGGLTVTGTGIVTLSGANSYTGTTTVNGGKLVLNNALALSPNTTLAVNSGAIVDLNGQSNNILNFAAGNAAGMISNSAAVTGTLLLTNWTTSLAALVADGTAGQVAIDDVAQYQAAGGSLINNNNTFSGGLTLDGGAAPAYTRFLFPGTAAPNGVPGNVTNSYFGRGTITIGRSAADRAQIYVAGGAGETVVNNLVVNTALGADRVGTFRVDATTLLLKGTVTANLAPLTFSCNSGSACSVIVAGQLTGPSGLWLRFNASAAGDVVTCTLSNVTANANNYQGGTEIDASGTAVFTLAMGAANQFPNGANASDVTNNGSLKLNGYSQTINGLWGSGTLDGVSGTPTLTIGANNESSTNACVVKNTTGSLSLTKTGSGIATFTGTLSYNGNTTVNGGILSLQQPSFYVNSTISIASGATLDLPNGGTFSVANLLLNGVYQSIGTYNSTTSPGYITGSGQLTITGGSLPDSWSGATSANWSQSNWAGGHNPPNTGDSINFTSATGVGGTSLNDDLTSSSFLISGINYSSDAAGFTVNGNAFNLGGAVSNNAASPQTIDDSFTLASVETLATTNPVGSLTLGGSLSGPGGINTTGPGGLTLSGANSYAGVTTIGGGTLLLGNPSALPTTTTLFLANGAILDLGGNGGSIADFNGSTGFSSLITNSASGTNVSTLTVSDWNVGLNSFIVDGATAPVALSFQSVGSVSGGSLNNNSNTFSGGLTIGNAASGSGYARLSLGSVPVSLGVPGNIISSPFGRGTITLGNSPGDYAQIFLDAATTNYTVLNNFVINSEKGSDRVGALRVDQNTVYFGGTLTANQAPVNFSCNATVNTTNAAVLYGQITGPLGLTLELNGASPAAILTVTLSNVTANANNYQGDTTVNAPHILALGAANQIPNGASAGNLLLDGTFMLNGYSQTINGLAGVSKTTGIVDGGSGTPTLTVGDNDAYSEFDGVITNSSGSLSLTKIGAGTLTLTATNAYSGNTTVDDGTLELGQPYLATNSTVIVASGATLQLDFSVTNTVSDLVLGGVSYTNGVFNNTTSPSYITGSGSLQVVPVATLPNTPTNISYSVIGSTLTISWPSSYVGWILQEQTNALNVGLQASSNAWFNVSGSASVSTMSLPISSSTPAAFYRLSHP
jgi:autotransporter-associated beta strand protein